MTSWVSDVADAWKSFLADSATTASRTAITIERATVATALQKVLNAVAMVATAMAVAM